MTELATGFPPIAAASARVLILGSMPGRASLTAGQYYAHPRNAFWPIMGALLGFDPAIAYGERCARLSGAGIALWDVIQTCRRRGSLDAGIEAGSLIGNDIPAFLAAHPGIRTIFFNGAAAATTFRRQHAAEFPRELALIRLPSSSPAYAGLAFPAKLDAWCAISKALQQSPVASGDTGAGPVKLVDT
ncbi:MAG: DNA-deoxyinosine glycosylase [Betaproteobacteria bacterium]|nr:DNA-deoxyinosine glycosylase [Betaproteobacteria bacterium]